MVYIISLNSLIIISNQVWANNQKTKIILPGQIELILNKYDHDELPIGTGWKNKLLVKNYDYILNVISPPINSEIDYGLYHYFVPVAKDRYYQDLNNDGYFEVALIATSNGNAMFIPAYVYSVRGNSLEFYKEAKYNQEGKLPIVFGCDGCNRWNLKSVNCKKCLNLLDNLRSD